MDKGIEWSRYFDGNIWLFRRGEDFDAPVARFQRRVYSVGYRHNRSVSMRRDGENVAVRFGPGEA